MNSVLRFITVPHEIGRTPAGGLMAREFWLKSSRLGILARKFCTVSVTLPRYPRPNLLDSMTNSWWLLGQSTDCPAAVCSSAMPTMLTVRTKKLVLRNSLGYFFLIIISRSLDVEQKSLIGFLCSKSFFFETSVGENKKPTSLKRQIFWQKAEEVTKSGTQAHCGQTLRGEQVEKVYN